MNYGHRFRQVVVPEPGTPVFNRKPIVICQFRQERFTASTDNRMLNTSMIKNQSLNPNTIIFCQPCKFHLLATVWLTCPLTQRKTGSASIEIIKTLPPELIVGSDGMNLRTDGTLIRFVYSCQNLFLKFCFLSLPGMCRRKYL